MCKFGESNKSWPDLGGCSKTYEPSSHNYRDEEGCSYTRQKPVALYKELIALFVNTVPHSWIMDVCSGAGMVSSY